MQFRHSMVIPLIILCLLVSPLVSTYLLVKYKALPSTAFNHQKLACWGLGICFAFFFIGHIVKTDDMIAMLPPWIPYRAAVIYLTGILELLVAVALFIRKYQRDAVKLAIIIFISFFPANIYSAVSAVGSGGHQWGAVYLLIRAPLQIILIAWAYYFCLNENSVKR